VPSHSTRTRGLRCSPSHRALLERAEPRLEASPLIKAFAVDRLPHLFGTGGVDSPLSLVELDACRLEVETAELEDATHAGIEIIDDVLVPDAQHRARQNLLP
jgi:hypothetical protein